MVPFISALLQDLSFPWDFSLPPACHTWLEGSKLYSLDMACITTVPFLAYIFTNHPHLAIMGLGRLLCFQTENETFFWTHSFASAILPHIRSAKLLQERAYYTSLANKITEVFELSDNLWNATEVSIRHACGPTYNFKSLELEAQAEELCRRSILPGQIIQKKYSNINGHGLYAFSAELPTAPNKYYKK